MNIGLFYPDIDNEGGYTRDIRRLYKELKSEGLGIYKLKGVKELITKRKELKLVHVFGIFKIEQILSIVFCRIFKIPYVITTFAHLMPMAMNKGYLKKEAFMKLIGSSLLNNADCIHVFTNTEKKSLEKYVRNIKCKVIPLGIYPEDLNTEIDSITCKQTNNPYILFLGRLDIYQKGIDLLIQGFTDYAQKGGKLNLIIAGRDWHDGASFISAKLKENEYKDQILFLGEVELEKMDDLILNAECFIYPSRFDGPPRPLRRALTLNKRVLASYQSNLCDDLEDNGWGLLFNADLKSISDAIIKFDNLINWPAFTNPGEILGWNIIAKQFMDMYNSINK